jgi:hypothetical protein
MASGIFTDKGSVDVSAYVMGDWEEIIAVKSAVNYHLGCCKEGVLEVSREFYRHMDNQFPRRMDAIIPMSIGMKFSGQLEELHSQNISLLLGQSLVPTNNYLYVGALEEAYFFTLRGMRRRVADAVALEFCIWKCISASLLSLAGGDEVIGTPFEAEGLDDSAGDLGGDSTMPLGWLYIPSKA